MTTCIYFALHADTRKIKVGSSRGAVSDPCPIVRIRALRKEMQFLGCVPLAESDDDLEIIKDLQTRFPNSHDGGNWFVLSEALQTYIQTETRGHVCSRCADETIEQKDAKRSLKRHSKASSDATSNDKGRWQQA